MNSADKQAVLHCLKSMIDEEVCEECPLYGTTGTDHCEKDCVRLAINELEQEPCEDAISRQAVLEAIEELKKIHFDRVVVLNKVCDRVSELPPVTPQPKMGYWEWNQYDANPKIGNFHCSLCHIIGRAYYDYCPGCGAEMSEIPTGAEGSEE